MPSIFNFLRDVFDADTEEDQKKRLSRGEARYYDDQQRNKRQVVKDSRARKLLENDPEGKKLLDKAEKGPRLSFLESAKDVAGVAAGAAREAIVKPATNLLVQNPRSSARGAVAKSIEELRQLSYEERKQALVENEGLRQVLKKQGIEDPTDENFDRVLQQNTEADEQGFKPEGRVEQAVFGNEPIQSYAQRRRGLEEELKEGTYLGSETVGGKGVAERFARPLSFVGVGLAAGLDAPGGGGKIAKEGAERIFKTGAKELAEEAPTVGKKAMNFLGEGARIDDIKPVTPEEGFRQRGLLKTTQAENLPESTRVGSRAVEPQTYKQLNIDESLTAARERVSTQFDEAKQVVDQKLAAGQWDDEASSLTRALVEKAGREGNDTLVTELMDKAAELGTRTGQANVLWRGMANAYDPEGMVRLAEKMIDKANKQSGTLTKLFRKGDYTLDDATKNAIREEMRGVLKLADGPEKDEAMKRIFGHINDRIPPGASELFDAYRYQNLLSNPRTQARNTISNLFNTMITRPGTLAARASTDWFAASLFGKDRQYYLKEVPQYYKGLFNSFGDATEAAKRAFKGDTPIGQPDLQSVQAFRRKNLPKGLRVIPGAMEAQDRFFSTLIAAGEYTAQKAKGVADDVARKEADKVAEYSLFRALSDPKNATGQGDLLAKMDQLAKLTQDAGSKIPLFRWFVPFIRTPVNVSKQFLEFSPVGLATLPGSSRKTEQFAKAASGTALTMIGAKMALDGQTTWDAPKDETERQLFYDSGKRPYSIKIGDKWIPMIYLGPFALAFALPAAARDANQDAPLDASVIEKIGDATQNSLKFFSQQTYLQGIANVVDLVSGEGDANLMNSLGFTAGQALPLQGFQRYIASVIDPTFRKADGFIESIQKDTPGLSKGLEAYTDLEGNESRRNVTDYVAPYTLGSETGTPEQRASREANSAFIKTLRKTSKPRSEADKEISAAIEANDYSKAQQIAASYNEKLKQAFEPWLKKYGEFAEDEYLVDEYNSQKIRLNRQSISRRRYYMRERTQRERSLSSR